MGKHLPYGQGSITHNYSIDQQFEKAFDERFCQYCANIKG